KSSRAAVTVRSVSSGATLPPGKAQKPPKKRSCSARWTSSTSAASGPRASSTLAACAIALTGRSFLGVVAPARSASKGDRSSPCWRCGLGDPMLFAARRAFHLPSHNPSFLVGLFLAWRRFRLLLGAQSPFHRLQEPLHRERLADVIDDAQVLGVRLVPAALVG